MAIMRLIMLGDGTPDDSYRADIPNYTTLATDAVNGSITVSQAARYGPPQLPQAGAPFWVVENGVTILVSMPSEMTLAWWQRLASQFPRREPPYQPAFLLP